VNTRKQHNKRSQKPNNNRDNKTIIGVISTTAKGVGYIDNIDPQAESICIEAGYLNTALNEDTVEVALNRSGQAEVKKVIKRARETFVGRVSNVEGAFIIIPDDRKMYTPIVLQIDQAKGTNLPKVDQKVFVKMLAWTNPKEMPRGVVVKVLGEKGQHNVEMESIVLESGFESSFPAEVEREARDIQQKEGIISTEEIARRYDMRDTLTFTIDPFDAKDFDDSISFRKLDSNESAGFKNISAGVTLYEIGVHIADVSHYVREGTALDKEAVKRGCSV